MNDSSIVGMDYRTLAEPITMRTRYDMNIEDKVMMSGLYENNRLIPFTTWGSSLPIYMCGRVPKRHRAVGLLESYDLRPTYSFHADALDRGHQPFEQSDWPSRSRDGTGLYTKTDGVKHDLLLYANENNSNIRIWQKDHIRQFATL